MEKLTKGELLEHDPGPINYNSFNTTDIPSDSQKQLQGSKSTKKDNFVKWLEKPATLAKTVAKTTEEWSICEYHTLPPWLQGNKYLTYGHRPPMDSVSACLKSILYLHTDTINIWTHLIGFILFITLGVIFYMKEPNLEERLALIPFFTLVILSLGLSVVFHTLSCYSPRMVKLTDALDYCSFAMLIMGCLIPWIYFRFHCYLWLQVFYISVILTLGSCIVIISFMDLFREPSNRYIRVIIFTMFALCKFIPVIHTLFMKDWKMTTGIATPYFLAGASFYISAAMFYNFKVPEMLKPGIFDIWFHSHQMFHVLLVGAALCNFRGLLMVSKETIKSTCL